MAAEFAYDYYQTIPLDLPEFDEEPKFEPRIVPKKKPTPNNRKAELERKAEQAKKTNALVAKAAVVTLIALLVISACIQSFSARSETYRQLQKSNEMLKIENERTTVLTDKLNKLVTEDNIDKYAAQLGLVKVARGNVNYIDSNPENHVVFSKGSN